MSFLRTLNFLILISHALSSPTKILEKKVVIIGAGTSGLAAATKLLENGVDVVVLEAETRIGGRIRTVKFADGNVDLGAHYCHGEKGNVVREMVKDLDLTNKMDWEFKVLTPDKKEVDESISKDAWEMFDEVYNNQNNIEENITTGDYFTKEYKKAVIKKYPDDVTKQNESIALISLFKHLIMSVDGSNDWQDSSAAGDYQVCEGDDLLWKDRGYKIFLDVLMKKYPVKNEDFDVESKILTGKVVEKIIWDDANKVLVKCEGGDEIRAEYVIFTPSLGVLKAKHGELFSPALPKEKIKAIESLGYGTIAVTSVHYPQAWWKTDIFKDFKGCFFLWPNENSSNDDNNAWIKDINGMFPVYGNPNVLEIWASGKNIATIENIDEATFIDGIDNVVRTFVGNTTNISKPDKIARGGWLTNPYFRGAYSYDTIESHKIKNPSSRENLMEPLVVNDKAVVMFAGEATNSIHYSTVHGAVETGWREAKRIIEDINKRK